jgi:hypothetical protein
LLAFLAARRILEGRKIGDDRFQVRVEDAGCREKSAFGSVGCVPTSAQAGDGFGRQQAVAIL